MTAEFHIINWLPPPCARDLAVPARTGRRRCDRREPGEGCGAQGAGRPGGSVHGAAAGGGAATRTELGRARTGRRRARAARREGWLRARGLAAARTGRRRGGGRGCGAQGVGGGAQGAGRGAQGRAEEGAAACTGQGRRDGQKRELGWVGRARVGGAQGQGGGRCGGAQLSARSKAAACTERRRAWGGHIWNFISSACDYGLTRDILEPRITVDRRSIDQSASYQETKPGKANKLHYDDHTGKIHLCTSIQPWQRSQILSSGVTMNILQAK